MKKNIKKKKIIIYIYILNMENKELASHMDKIVRNAQKERISISNLNAQLAEAAAAATSAKEKEAARAVEEGAAAAKAARAVARAAAKAAAAVAAKEKEAAAAIEAMRATVVEMAVERAQAVWREERVAARAREAAAAATAATAMAAWEAAEARAAAAMGAVEMGAAWAAEARAAAALEREKAAAAIEAIVAWTPAQKLAVEVMRAMAAWEAAAKVAASAEAGAGMAEAKADEVAAVAAYNVSLNEMLDSLQDEEPVMIAAARARAAEARAAAARARAAREAALKEEVAARKTEQWQQYNEAVTAGHEAADQGIIMAQKVDAAALLIAGLKMAQAAGAQAEIAARAALAALERNAADKQTVAEANPARTAAVDAVIIKDNESKNLRTRVSNILKSGVDYFTNFTKKKPIRVRVGGTMARRKSLGKKKQMRTMQKNKMNMTRRKKKR